MEIEYQNFHFSIHTTDWVTGEVSSLALRDNLIYLDGNIAGELAQFRGASANIHHLTTMYPDFFKLMKFSSSRVRVLPEAFEEQVINHFSFIERAGNPATFAELDQLRGNLFFQIAPIGLEVNHKSWIISENLKFKSIHPQHLEHTAYFSERTFDKSGEAHENYFVFGFIKGDTFVYLSNAKSGSFEIHKSQWRMNDVADAYKDWLRFISKRTKQTYSHPATRSILEVLTTEAIRQPDRFLAAAVRNLLKYRRPPRRSEPAPNIDEIEAALGEKRGSNNRDLRMYVSLELAEKLVVVLRTVFEAERMEEPSIAGAGNLVPYDENDIWAPGCEADLQYQRVHNALGGHVLDTEVEFNQYINGRIYSINQKIELRNQRLQVFEEMLSRTSPTYSQICTYIENLPLVYDPVYVDELWFQAYGVRDEPGKKLEKVIRERDKFQQEVESAKKIAKKIGWPADAPPLLAAVWGRFGGRAGSAKRWAERGWSPLEVLIRDSIPGCGGLLLSERLNLKNPPTKVDA